MQLLGEGHSTLEIAKTLGRDHRTIKKVANNVNKSPDKENQEIQGQTHKAGLFTALITVERDEENPLQTSKQVFDAVAEFPGGEQDNMMSNSVHL